MSKYTILCIDDEERVLHALERLFIEEDYRILTTTSGQEGLEILKNEKIDIVISDQRLPGIKGIDILKRAKNISPATARIMITGYSDIDVTISAINEGAIHHYFTKPWDSAEFKAIIRNILQKKNNQNCPEETAAIKKIEWQIRDLTMALRRASFTTVRALSNAIELKDKYTKGHCDRVLSYALLIANSAGLSSNQIANLKYAAVLHDIGKIGVPALILNKNGALTDEEWDIIKEHPRSGANIIKEIDLLKAISRIILEHHERLDGKGYPYGKKEDDILKESKIIAIADVFDALTSDRPYRKAFEREKAIGILEEGKGHQFDGKLVDIFIREIMKP